MDKKIIDSYLKIFAGKNEGFVYKKDESFQLDFSKAPQSFTPPENELLEEEKSINWFTDSLDFYLERDREGEKNLFYTGTSKKRAESIQREGFKVTTSTHGTQGVWFYGGYGCGKGSFDNEYAKKSALSHAKYRAIEDDSDMALIELTIPTSAIEHDFPYQALKTTSPELITIISIEYSPLPKEE